MTSSMTSIGRAGASGGGRVAVAAGTPAFRKQPSIRHAGTYTATRRAVSLDPKRVRNTSGDDPVGARHAREPFIASDEGELALQHCEGFVAAVIVPRR